MKAWFRSDVIGALIGLLIGLFIGLIGTVFNTPVWAIAVVVGLATGFSVAKILPLLHLGESVSNFTMRFFGPSQFRMIGPVGLPPRVELPREPVYVPPSPKPVKKKFARKKKKSSVRVKID